jgi:23S rRNA pseudouridine1911/1915/1917 synthase
MGKRVPTQRSRAGKPDAQATLTVEGAERPALAGFLRSRLPERTWGEIKRLIAAGRVSVDGEAALDPGQRLSPGSEVRLAPSAPRARPRGEVRIVHDDPHVVVIDKPSGISSVPFERGERGTAMDLVREAWRRMGRPVAPLLVAHRIDKDTSGLLCFAKTNRALLDLQRQFRAHEVERTYLCVAHGDVRSGTIESRLVDDRGDGLRGSARREDEGRLAITHVTPLRHWPSATLCLVRLETGKTHQIRIHLAEAGHPLVGETVYIRDFERAGHEPLARDRLLLHAATLGFRHPTTGEPCAFEAALPADFDAALAHLDAVSRSGRNGTVKRPLSP